VVQLSSHFLGILLGSRSSNVLSGLIFLSVALIVPRGATNVALVSNRIRRKDQA